MAEAVSKAVQKRKFVQRVVRPRVQRVAMSRLPTVYGDFELFVYRTLSARNDCVALTRGNILSGKHSRRAKPVMVRLHSECATGEVFGSLRCDCGEQLRKALKMIQTEGRGVFLYLRQEGRGIGFINKIKAYTLQDRGCDTVDANERLGFAPDAREYGIAAAVLKDLGLKKIRLITNNPQKVAGLERCGIAVAERLPIEVFPNRINRGYLLAKKKKLGHLLKNV